MCFLFLIPFNPFKLFCKSFFQSLNKSGLLNYILCLFRTWSAEIQWSTLASFDTASLIWYSHCIIAIRRGIVVVSVPVGNFKWNPWTVSILCLSIIFRIPISFSLPFIISNIHFLMHFLIQLSLFLRDRFIIHWLGSPFNVKLWLFPLLSILIQRIHVNKLIRLW